MIDISKPILDANDIKEIAKKADAIGVDTINAICDTMCNRLVKKMLGILEDKGFRSEQEIALNTDKVAMSRKIGINAKENERLRTLIKSLHLGKVNEQATLSNIKYDRFGNYIVCGMACIYYINVKETSLIYDMTWTYNSIERMSTLCKEIETVEKVLSSIVSEACSNKEKMSSARISGLCREIIESTRDKYTINMKFIDLYNKIYDKINHD